MAKQTVAEQFIDILVRAGVQRLYGVVGDSLNPVVDAVRRNRSLEWVHVRHEETAAFAAGAEAQLTGRLAACSKLLRPGQPASDQRPVRRPPLDGPGARARLAHPQQRDRHQLLPGDAPRPAVHGVQPLQRADLQRPADAAGAADRDPARGGPRRGLGDHPAGRHRRAPGAAAQHRARAGDPQAVGQAGRRGDRRPGPAGGRRPPRHPLLRQRHRGRPRRGDGLRRAGQVAGGARAARQGVDPVRQPLRRGHERTAGLRGGVRGDARVRPAAPAGHRLPLQRLPAGRRDHRAGRRPPRTPRPHGRRWTWRCGATWRRRCAA